MGHILQSLVCITAMMSSVLSQRGYYQEQTRNIYPLNSREVIYSRNLQYNQQNPENLYRRIPDVRKFNLETNQENTRIERETLEKYGSQINDRVVFPGPTSNGQSIKKEEGPKLTEECKKRGYCGSDEVLNYPEEYVSNLIAELGDEVNKFPKDAKDDSVQIAQRLGGGSSEQEVPLCSINETLIYPKSLPDKDGKWWFVVNQDGNPVQSFLAELCKDEGSNCSEVVKFQSGYKGTCKQKYVYRMVEAIDNGQHKQKQLRLPGCCSCSVTAVNPFRR